MKLPFKTNNMPGTLIAVEGASRSGKSTFIKKYTSINNVIFVSWNSFQQVHELTTYLKHEEILDKWSFCLTHLLDYVLSYNQIILPSLEEGKTVITDRYFYTSWVRDTIRGVPREFLLEFYKHFVQPNYIFYFEVSESIAFERYEKTRTKFGKYGTGQDIFPHSSADESFLRYHILQITEYQKLIQPNKFIVERHDEIMEEILNGISKHVKV